jgi:DNA modification methylase
MMRTPLPGGSSHLDDIVLRRKRRRGRPGLPSAAQEYGSLYATLPPEVVERAGWKLGEPFQVQVEPGRVVLAKSLGDDRTGGQPVSAPRFQFDQVLCGDVLDEMGKIPDNSVHMAITSPPYNVGAGYVDYSDDREYGEYRLWLSKVWRETKRVLVPGGRFALNIAPTSIANYRPVHMDLSQDVEEAGLKPRTEIVWYKQNMTAKRTAWGSFKSPRHPHVIPSWEYVLVFHKDQWKLEGDSANADISSKDFVAWSDGMWRINPETKHHADHPAAFPEELIRRLLHYFTYRENTILDMFGGTGTVAAVAKQLGRHYIHIDVSSEYCSAAEERLRGGMLLRGKRTKPSQRSIAREINRRTRDPKNSLESFGGPAPI